jgi:hypothetical protein
LLGWLVACFVAWLVVWLVQEINPLNTELNPICHLLALLGAHHILHVSRIRVKWHRIRNDRTYIKEYLGWLWQKWQLSINSFKNFSQTNHKLRLIKRFGNVFKYT